MYLIPNRILYPVLYSRYLIYIPFHFQHSTNHHNQCIFLESWSLLMNILVYSLEILCHQKKLSLLLRF